MSAQMAVANGIQQCYEITGPDNAPWVTLIHGSGDNHAAWGLQVPELAETYRVLAYDVRGHGETETPDDQPVSQETFVEDLRGLLDALEIPQTALIGYSMGGGIARNFAAAHPDRLWGLLLSNGGRLDPPADPLREEEMRKMREERIVGIRAGGMDSVFDGWLTSVYTPEFVAARPEIVEWHRKIMTSNNPEHYVRILGGATSSANFDLSRITMPTLIVVGAGDEYTGPEQAQDLAKALTGAKAEVNVFPTRHGSPFERHEEYNRTLLAFLDANRPASTS